MNCFQKFVSLIFWATRNNDIQRKITLWIAFKSLYLWYSEQQIVSNKVFTSGCELLSKVCIFDILSNSSISYRLFSVVVNCFQKFVSLIFWATQRSKASAEKGLWIAFKSLYLWYSEQRSQYYADHLGRCELLSKVCIFDILSNHTRK